MLKGFKSFLMRGDVIVIAVGLVVALAFSNLVKAFTDSIINPLVAAAQGGNTLGLGLAGRQRREQSHLPRRRGVHLGDHLFPGVHGGCLLRDRVALQAHFSQAGCDGVRRAGADDDLPGVLVRRSSGCGEQMQILRHRPGGVRRQTRGSHKSRLSTSSALARRDGLFLCFRKIGKRAPPPWVGVNILKPFGASGF